MEGKRRLPGGEVSQCLSFDLQQRQEDCRQGSKEKYAVVLKQYPELQLGSSNRLW
jgi:hypothetical protein